MRKLALLILFSTLPASAGNMRSVPETDGYCGLLGDKSAICYEWQLTTDSSIRFVAEGYEDGIDYGFFRLGKDHKYTHIVSVYPVIRDPSRSDALFWGYPWDIEDIAISADHKTKSILFSTNHNLSDDGEISIAKRQKHVPAVLFIGKTTQPGMTVPPLKFRAGTMKNLRSAAGG